MGRFICYLVLFVLLSTAGWATPNLFSGPESVAWDSVHNRWLVSNYTAGNVIAVDEYGSLSIFAEGLGNCLGNEIVGNTLYVSTRTTVVGLDLTTGEQIVTIPFTPIQNMDGLAADTSGHLYAIDTGGRLFKINLSDHSTSLFVGWGLASNVQDCTFDEIHNRLLLVIWAASASASIMAVDLPDSTVYPICPNGIGFFDGVVTDGKGNTFAGSYAGTNSVWRWDSTYSDPPTRIAADNEGPAGLAYNRDNDVLAIPNFNANRVRFVNTVADFTADVVLGWPPLEVTFTGSTPDTVDAWSWDFGDGDTDAGQVATHIYTDPGLHDVTLTADPDGEAYMYTRSHLVGVLADTIRANDVEAGVGDTVDVLVGARNTVPLHKLVMPLEYGGPLELEYLDHSVAGYRLEHFSDIDILNFDPANRRLTLSFDTDGGAYLNPGEGDLIRFRFVVTAVDPSGGEAVLALDGYGGYLPSFTANAGVYQPVDRAGSVFFAGCCFGDRGNVVLVPDCDYSDQTVDVGDLTNLINHLFISFPDLCCVDEADIAPVANPDGVVDVGDLTALIDHLFITFPPLVGCD